MEPWGFELYSDENAVAAAVQKFLLQQSGQAAKLAHISFICGQTSTRIQVMPYPDHPTYPDFAGVLPFVP
jgi:hypothetical protein